MTSLIFSQRSAERLNTCDRRIIAVMHDVISPSTTDNYGFDITVLEGHRTEATHLKYIKSGATRVPYSKTKHRHSPSRAVDIAPWITDLGRMADWNNPNELRYFYYMAGFVQRSSIAILGYPLRWGGNWDGDSIIGVGAKSDDQTFNDLVHFELPGDVI